MWLCVCDIPPPPSPPPMRAAFSSWVQTPYPFQLCKTIVTSWKGLCGYDRDDMSCQDFCTVCLLRTFPSHYSICKQHVIRAVQHLHVVFSCFLIFCDDLTNWEYYCESAIIFCGPQILPVPVNPSLAVHELWYIYQNNICFWRLWSMGFKLLEKHNLIYLSNALIFIYKRCRTRESL